MFSCLALAVLSLAQAGPAWPGFLGPQSADLESNSLPLHWSPEQNIAWRASLPGYGQSSPVVWGEHVYVTTVEGAMKDTFRLSAWQLDSGAQAWVAEYSAATKVENTVYVSRAAPTPVADAAGVIALFEDGTLVALDHAGQPRWQKSLTEEYGAIESEFGLGASLVQDDRALFVWVERSNDPYVVAFDKHSGSELWKVVGRNARSWSTPALVPTAAGDQLVLSAPGSVVGLAPATGEQLWQLEGLAGNSVPTPVPLGEGRFLLGANVSPDERNASQVARSNSLVQIASDGRSADFVWHSERASCSFGSPVAHQGLVYLVNTTGALFCLDAATGEELYAERVAESVWATPLAVGERIYFFGKAGTTTVIAADRDFKVLAENQLWEADDAPASGGQRGGGMFGGPVQYGVAAVPGSLLIRRGDRLYCLRDQARASRD